MATTVHRYVDTDAAGTGTGESYANAYTSLNGINAYAKDLTTADEIVHVHVKASAGTEDTTRFSAAAAWVTDATRYILIDVEDNKGGKFPNTTYRLVNTLDSNEAMNFASAGPHHVIIKNLAVRNQIGAGLNVAAFQWQGGGAGLLRMENCIITQTLSATFSGAAVRLGNVGPKGAQFINCVIDGDNRKGYAGWLQSVTTSGVVLYNTNLIGSVARPWGGCALARLIAKNVIHARNASNQIATAFTVESTNNASDVGEFTAYSGNSHTFLFRNSASVDYRLLKTDTGAKGLGTSLAADANFPFSTDIENARRGTTWDIGADQVTAYSESAVAGRLILKGFAANEEAVAAATSNPISSRLIFKGYPPVETGAGTGATEEAIAGKVWFKGYPATETAFRIFTENPVCGKLLFKGMPPVESGFSGVNTPLHSAFILKGYEPVVLATKWYQPSQGLVTFHGTEGGGELEKTLPVEVGKLSFVGKIANTLYIRFYADPFVGKITFKGYPPDAFSGRAIRVSLGRMTFVGKPQEANQAVATKTVSHGVFHLIGLLPEGNNALVNATSVRGLLSFKAFAPKVYSGGLELPVAAQFHFICYAPTAILQKYTAIPIPGVISFKGHITENSRWARVPPPHGVFHYKGYEAYGSGGLWIPVEPDQSYDDQWTAIAPDGEQ